MKAAQINSYSKEQPVKVVDVPIPSIQADELLIKVKVAAVNPLDIMNKEGSVKLIQNYQMPLTLGNELTGVVEKVGDEVTNFKIGDPIYTRLPIGKIGAFAEYVAVAASAVGHLPKNLDFVTGAGAALTGLTAYQALTGELQAKKGQTVFIPGASGSFGQMAVPIAKAMGLKVVVSGNSASKERILQSGADQYLEYTKENYWEVLNKVDYVIDTLGATEFDHELLVLKAGGKLLSLRTSPNRRFAETLGLPKWKQLLFGLVGRKFDKKAKEKNIDYYFIFVRADGNQLKEITKIIEEYQVVPMIDSTEFTLADINEALALVDKGHPKGKVVIKF